MQSNYLENLLDYDSQMNYKMLNLLRGLSSINENSKNIFAHLLTAKKIWIKRLQSEDWTNISIWPTLSMDECGALIEENRISYQNYLQGKSEAHLQANIQYKNSKGIVFENSVQDVLIHLLIHGGYHRGQIAKAVRESGEEPINTDYIFYIREQIPRE